MNTKKIIYVLSIILVLLFLYTLYLIYVDLSNSIEYFEQIPDVLTIKNKVKPEEVLFLPGNYKDNCISNGYAFTNGKCLNKSLFIPLPTVYKNNFNSIIQRNDEKISKLSLSGADPNRYLITKISFSTSSDNLITMDKSLPSENVEYINGSLTQNINIDNSLLIDLPKKGNLSLVDINNNQMDNIPYNIV